MNQINSEEVKDIVLNDKNKKMIKRRMKYEDYFIQKQFCKQHGNYVIEYYCMFKLLTQQEREQKLLQEQSRNDQKPTMNSKDIEVIAKIVKDTVSESETRIKVEINEIKMEINNIKTEINNIKVDVNQIKEKLELHHKLMIEHGWIKE